MRASALAWAQRLGLALRHDDADGFIAAYDSLLDDPEAFSDDEIDEIKERARLLSEGHEETVSQPADWSPRAKALRHDDAVQEWVVSAAFEHVGSGHVAPVSRELMRTMDEICDWTASPDPHPADSAWQVRAAERPVCITPRIAHASVQTEPTLESLVSYPRTDAICSELRARWLRSEAKSRRSTEIDHRFLLDADHRRRKEADELREAGMHS
mmetsp:Transcript_13405/g.39513  ORF Transcript_13405/g.39513 Transcript_13405/m.39513 type:complete len:213 (-) Transcript_13405:474-1112(-)